MNVVQPSACHRPWAAFTVTGIGVFMATLDAGIVGVVMPTISRQFGADLSHVQWIGSAYLLTICCLLPLMGRMGDLWGKKPLFRAGFILFIVGSALCGVSTTLWMLVASRVVQAVGAAAIMALGPAFIMTCFPGPEKGRALGTNAMIVAVGSMFGPGLGGLIISAMGWPYVFYLNLPIGVIGWILSARYLPDDGDRRRESLDLPGVGLFALGVTALILALNHGSDWGWATTPVFFLALLATVSLYAFCRREKRAPQPMIDTGLVLRTSFLLPCLAAFLCYLAQYINAVLMPFYLQMLLGLSTSQVGLVLSALPTAMAISSPMAGFLSEKVKPSILSTLGLMLVAAGLFSQTFLDGSSSIVRAILGQAFLGLAFGFFNAPNNNTIMSSAPLEKSGLVGGLLALVRNLGMVMGITAATAVFEMSHTISGSVYGKAGSASFLTGFRTAMFLAAGLAVLGAILSVARASMPRTVGKVGLLELG